MKKIMFLMVLSFIFLLAVGTDNSPSQVVQPATNETPVLYDPFDREDPVVKLPGLTLIYIRGHDRGEAIFFDGKTYLREAALTFVPAGKNWVEGTVEFWIKPAQYPFAPQNSQIVLFNWFDLPKPESGYVGNISLTSEGKIMADCGWEWGGGNPPVITSQSTVLLNTWTHVAVAWSKAEGYVRIYINNKPDAVIDTYCASGSNGSIYPWLAGYGGFVGALDEFKIYKMAVAPPFYVNADKGKNDTTAAKSSGARQKEKKKQSVADFVQYVVPQGWTAADEMNQGDPQSTLTRDMHTIKVRLSGGPGSRYKLPEEFLAGFEARSHGGKPGEKLDWVVISGVRVLIYKREISVNLPPPGISGSISLTQEEFCVVPAGKRFFILNYSYGDSIPDPTYDGQKVWRQFLKGFRLKKTVSSE